LLIGSSDLVPDSTWVLPDLNAIFNCWGQFPKLVQKSDRRRAQRRQGKDEPKAEKIEIEELE
jgi:hypothetical protein